MDKFFELLERIEKKRYLYIGDDNLIALKHLMDGYAQCLIDYGIKSKESISRLKGLFTVLLKQRRAGNLFGQLLLNGARAIMKHIPHFSGFCMHI